MSLELSTEGTSRVRLPPVADLTFAADLKTALIEALDTGKSLEIDASDIQRITSPCLQVLAAAIKRGEGESPGFSIVNPSAAFLEAASTLALDDALGLKGE